MFNATPFLKLYAAYRRSILSRSASRAGGAALQEAQLLSLVRRAKGTLFGHDHHFEAINSVAEYQKIVPLRTYEQIWKQYWQPKFPTLTNCTWPGTIPYFPVSSGTSSGVTKYIPCTHEMLHSNTKAGVDLLTHHVSNRPNSQIFAGRSFMLGGSTDLSEQAPGIFCGDLSGITARAMPWWAKARYFPPAEIALLKNWEEKIEILAHESLTQNIRLIGGVPSWLVIFFGKLQEITGGKALHEIYPDLEMLVHGGVNFAPYHKQFEGFLKGGHAEMREVYPASEGFIAVADRGYAEGLRLNLDHGIFYEFIPLEELETENPTRHWLGDIETGINYAIALTTCAGLWSYVIGDTVRFVDAAPARLLVTGRTSYYLSAFGEHLIAEEIEDAVTQAATSISASVSDYSVGALYPEQAGELGGHLYIVEFAQPHVSAEAQTAFTQSIDLQLCKRNEDYEAHRAKGFGLNPPKLTVLPPGTFAEWMRSRGKLGGQNKVPRIISDPTLFKNLRQFADKLTHVGI